MAYSRKFAKRRYGRKGAYPRKRKSSYSTKRIAKIAKRVVMKTAEPKHVSYTFGKAELYHNTFYMGKINDAVCMPDPGTQDNNRIGDQINISGFKLRIMLGQKADRPNVTFKIYVVRVPKGSSYNYSQWFENMTNNVLLDSPNTDFIKVLHSSTWKPHDGSMDNATDEYVYSRTLWIPYKHKLKFGPANGAETHNDNDIYFMYAPFDAYGTLITDNIAYIEYVSTMHYRDP